MIAEASLLIHSSVQLALVKIVSIISVGGGRDHFCSPEEVKEWFTLSTPHLPWNSPGSFLRRNEKAVVGSLALFFIFI